MVSFRNLFLNFPSLYILNYGFLCCWCPRFWSTSREVKLHVVYASHCLTPHIYEFDDLKFGLKFLVSKIYTFCFPIFSEPSRFFHNFSCVITHLALTPLYFHATYIVRVSEWFWHILQVDKYNVFITNTWLLFKAVKWFTRC